MHPSRTDWRQGFLNLMGGDGNAKDDVKVPDTDIGKEIEAAFDDGKELMVTIIAAMGELCPMLPPLTDSQMRSRQSRGRRPRRRSKPTPL